METETLILISILLMTWAEIVWDLYLTFRQRNVIKKTLTVPNDLQGIMTEETFSKARLYQYDSITFGIYRGLFDNIVGLATIVFYLFPFVWKLSENLSARIGFKDNEALASVVYMQIMLIFQTIIGLPFSIYSTFVIEEKYGFNKQTPSFYIKDTIKKIILSMVFISILIPPTVLIINAGGDYFFIYLWLFTIVASLFFLTIYPDFIAPLFDKYTPLPDGELKTRIEQLAASISFPLKKLYVVEGSKRSAHSNAYFYGFYKNKRIVLFDTLLKDYKPSTAAEEEKPNDEDESSPSIKVDEKKSDDSAKGCTNDEVLAVLAHELGHWKGNHVLKHIIMSQVNLFLMFMVFSKLFKYEVIYRAFGFYDCQPVFIGLVIILQFIFLPYNIIFSFLATIISRRFEFQADEFAKSLGNAEYLKRALIKLNLDNLGFPVYDYLYSTFHHSHPPLLERLKALGKCEIKYKREM